MKLREYFLDQKSVVLSDYDKHFLLDKISKEKNQLTKRLIFSRKYFYTSVTVVLIFMILGVYFTPQNVLIDHVLFWTEKDHSINGVSADQIGEIVQIQGEFSIEKDRQMQTSLMLFDGDKIILKPGTRMSFAIEEGHGEIIGPAIFIVSRTTKGYHINLLEGNFLQFDAPQTHQNFVIETEDLNVHTERGAKNEISFQLLKSEGKTYIKNNGNTLLVQKKNNSNESTFLAKKEQKLENDQIFSIPKDDDIVLIEDQTTFLQLLAQNQITYTKDFSVNTGEGEEEPQVGLAMYQGKEEITESSLISGWIPSIDTFSEISLEEISQNLSAISDEQGKKIDPIQGNIAEETLNYQRDHKKIPTEDQLSYISASLNLDFLHDDLFAMYRANQLGLEDRQLLQQQFASKIAGLAKVFDISLELQGSSFFALQTYLEIVQQGLNKYHIPPTKNDQIGVLIAWMKYFSKSDFEKPWEEVIGLDTLNFN